MTSKAAVVAVVVRLKLLMMPQLTIHFVIMLWHAQALSEGSWPLPGSIIFYADMSKSSAAAAPD